MLDGVIGRAGRRVPGGLGFFFPLFPHPPREVFVERVAVVEFVAPTVVVLPIDPG